MAPVRRPGRNARRSRVDRLVEPSKHRAVSDRNIAIVLFNFPPNGGAVGTAPLPSCRSSSRCYNTLTARCGTMATTSSCPRTVDGLRRLHRRGQCKDRYGTDANVHARVSRSTTTSATKPHLADIEAQWGRRRDDTKRTARSICFVLGAQFGNVFVGIQPAFGYEGDPMRLLFESGFAPTHAFSAFYRYLRDDFGADVRPAFRYPRGARVHAGQAGGLGRSCWPDRLIGPAELLPVRGEQPVRGRARQAPFGGHAGQLPDTAGVARGRAVPAACRAAARLAVAVAFAAPG